MAEIADQKIKRFYEFGPFRVDPEKEILLRDGEAVPLAPKTFQVLLVLMRHSQELVTKDDIMKMVNSLHKHDVAVSLFVDAELHQIKAAVRTGARFIELHTGQYASAYDFGEGNEWEEELVKLDNMAQVAQKSGLMVNAGHGLNYRNVGPISEIKGIWELNIGHSIVGRAVLVGFERAVRDMKELLRGRG